MSCRHTYAFQQTLTSYQFGGQTVAQRSSNTLTYLHGDHLGSVSLTTDAKGNLSSSQEFKPWGASYFHLR